MPLLRTALSSFLFSVLFLNSHSAIAFEKENWGAGFHYRAGNYSIADKKATTETTRAGNVGVQLRYKPQIRGRHYFGTLDFIDFELDESTDGNIHNEVSGLQFTAGIQQRLNIARNTKLWISGGYAFGSTKTENRFTIASDGFLENVYPNHRESISSISLSVDSFSELSHSNDLQWGMGLFVDIPIDDGVEAVGLKFTLLKD